jgi:hypothetical protein
VGRFGRIPGTVPGTFLPQALRGLVTRKSASRGAVTFSPQVNLPVLVALRKPFAGLAQA